jgi:hypothetical protein
LAVDEHVAQRERLRHPDDRVVYGLLAVRVILADHVSDDARRLLIRTVPLVAELAHRVQDAAVHRLQPVADVRQRAADDHAHRVIEIALPHLVFEIDREDFLTDGHGSCSGSGPVRK